MIAGDISVEGTGGKHNAGSSIGLPRRYGSTDRAYNSRKTSSLVPAPREEESKERDERTPRTTLTKVRQDSRQIEWYLHGSRSLSNPSLCE